MKVDSKQEPTKLVASAIDWAESAKIEQVLRDEYHQFESVADRNKKRQILAKL